MREIRSTSGYATWSVAVVLFCLLNAGSLEAQQIRVLAEPNQSLQLSRGGYVCEGQLTYTPQTSINLDTVQCTGPIYNAPDYAAVQAKLNHDELVKLNETMDHLSRLSQQALDRQAQELNQDLKATIERRFQTLPHSVQASADVQNLKQHLLEYVDQRVIPGTAPFGTRAPIAPPPPETHAAPTPPAHQH